MGAWNYPVSLVILPLVGAIAAGNRVLIKPSEYTPHTASVLAEMIHTTFGEDEIQVITGGVEAAEESTKALP